MFPRASICKKGEAMKMLAIAAALLLGACALTPEERGALTGAAVQIGVSALNKLAEIGKSPVAVSQTTHELMTYGCDIVENQKAAFDPLFALLLARINADTENPVTADELSGYITTGCSILDQLPIKAE